MVKTLDMKKPKGCLRHQTETKWKVDVKQVVTVIDVWYIELKW